MITLITGTPGSGKTAWTVQELTRLPNQRKIYVHGIPELKLAHEPIFCRSQLCDICNSSINSNTERKYVEDYYKWATDGSLIVIDEVQRIWRPSNTPSNLPEAISRLETHRHSGFDIWLISQGPHLFHSNIRLLIGRHIHLVNSWKGRTEYEFPECRQDVSRRSDAISRPYTLPKKIFPLYKSSSLHTSQKLRKPISLYIFIALLLILITSTIYVSNRFKQKEHQQQVEVNIPIPPQHQPQQPKTTDYPDFEPQIPGVPASAPAYSGMHKVTSLPVIIGCIKIPGECRCYTRQAIPIMVSARYCGEYMRGRIFNPFRRIAEQSVHDSHIASNEYKPYQPNSKSKE